MQHIDFILTEELASNRRFFLYFAVAKWFTERNRFFSYAPERSGIEAQWFVDGSSYMSAVADALEAAQDEIFICDWWLSPEIYLKRPIIEGERWRLDKILERKAVRSVSISSLGSHL